MLAAALLLIGLWPGAPSHAQTPGSAGVPVTVVSPVREDVPVLVRAIGTVQAFQSVMVRARVDGTLDKVLFTEGQQVRPGDLLAQLDPRPYQAALDQAVAKRAADAALLANARSELVRYADLAQSQAASRQRLELQRANVAQAEANVQGGDAAISANSGALRMLHDVIERLLEDHGPLKSADEVRVFAADGEGFDLSIEKREGPPHASIWEQLPEPYYVPRRRAREAGMDV